MSSSPTTVVIHGHFYQPPRENPWTGAIDREPSAAPAHDWNERVHDECYRPNAFARVFDNFGKIKRLVNTYEHLSFNFGPTVLSWMERQDPATYTRILAADAASVRARGGHGNAIAQGYNHAILPLCNPRDRVTQVRWGIADFHHRFGRAPESMWLPETAANEATLETLIDAGLRYVILAPSQAARVRPDGASEHDWRDVGDGSIDPGVAYNWYHRDGSGRAIACFFYDGPIARAIAFEGALSTSQTLVSRLLAPEGGEGRIVHVATDGESYGHHHRYGERALAYALIHEGERHGLRFANYGQVLERHPPRWQVEIKGGEGTAWSCAHGLGRWLRDCGCSTGAAEGWNQAWRAPLRRALDLLRDQVAERYQAVASELFVDPWAARDDYIELVLDRGRSHHAWLEARARRQLGEEERMRALTLLEAQRHAMLMYTSCGWFFADISGIETVQVLRYASRVLELMEDLDLDPPREQLLDVLATARSNLPEHGTGADIFTRWASEVVPPVRVAAHVGISALVEEAADHAEVAIYRCERASLTHERNGRLTMVTARVALEQIETRRRHDFAVAALHMGGVDFYGVVRAFPGARRFHAIEARLWESFHSASLPVLLRNMQEELGPDEFGLDGVLPGGSHRIAELVLGEVVRKVALQSMELFDANQRSLELLHRSGFELPRELRTAAETALSHRFAAAVIEAKDSGGPLAFRRATEIAADALARGFELDRALVRGPFGAAVAEVVQRATETRERDSGDAAAALASLAGRLHLEGVLARAQEKLWLVHEAEGAWPPELTRLATTLRFDLDEEVRLDARRAAGA